MRVIWIVPVGPLLLFGFVLMFSGGGGYGDPDKMTPISISDYNYQAEAYISESRKEDAVTACEAIVPLGGESPYRLCLLNVYKKSHDIDGQIEVNKLIMADEIAAGDVAGPIATQRTLDWLYEEKERKESSKFKRFQPWIDRLTVP
ncbi:MAG: hypothetical protein AAGE59_13380 [Cyanobacteria bacterium P01_F01_bin.86]